MKLHHGLRHVLTTLALVLALSDSARSDSPWGESDHTLFLRVESDPSGALVYNRPATTNEAPVLLGHTPLVIPVAMRWPHGWLGKKWSELAVRAPGNVVDATYDPADKSHQMKLHLALEKEGFARLEVDDDLLYFDRPKEIDWDDVDFVPARRTLTYTLQATASQTAATGPAWRTVMLGLAGRTGGSGSVAVEANVPAQVTVDGTSAGSTPVKLILGPGPHTISLQADGYAEQKAVVEVKPDVTQRLTSTLTATAP